MAKPSRSDIRKRKQQCRQKNKTAAPGIRWRYSAKDNDCVEKGTKKEESSTPVCKPNSNDPKCQPGSEERGMLKY